MTLSKLYEKYEYTPPCGDIFIQANVHHIMDNLLTKPGFSDIFELTVTEFTSFFRAFKDELLVSMLLSKEGNTMNYYFENGIEFRGTIVKII